MLARSAQGLYWMSRYFQRAEHLCRMLRLQSEALVDRPIREIYFGWSRIYGSINREPPWGGLEMLDSDEYTLADSYTLADELTFERTNPDSIWSCFALGRENARQMRRSISAEMWTCLNMTYLGLQTVRMQDIWRVSPESFYADTAASIDTLTGIASTTMYRDEGWSFMRLGHVIERAQLSATLLLTQIAVDRASEESSDADWTSLLRLCHALEAYNRRYGVEVEPGQVVDFLATDPGLPGSLCRSLDAAAADLAGIGPGPNSRSSDATRRLVGQARALLHYEWPDRDDREHMLRKINGYCRDLHDLVTASYFDYAIDDRPER